MTEIYKSFIPNKNTFTEFCVPGSFEIHQYVANCTVLADTVNETVYKTKPIFTDLGYGKLS